MCIRDRYAHTPAFHYRGARVPGWEIFIDFSAMALVYQLAKDYNCLIVVISTLRRDPYLREGLLLAAPLWAKEENGEGSIAFNLLSPFITGNNNTREEEILTFVAKHNVEKYVVIDDRKLDTEFLVHVSPGDGFTLDAFYKAGDMLADENHPVVNHAIFL